MGSLQVLNSKPPSVTHRHCKYLTKTGSNIVRQIPQLRKSNIHACFFTAQRFVREANRSFNDTLVRIGQRGDKMNGCKTGKQITKKNILTANLGKKGLASTRQINQLACPWQRYNCQVFKFQIMIRVWVIKAWSFCENTWVAHKACWTAVTAGTSEPSPFVTCKGCTAGCGLRTLEAYL